MATYRAYFLDANFRFVSAKTPDFANDTAALTWAIEVARDRGGEGVELWEGSRFIKTVRTLNHQHHANEN